MTADTVAAGIATCTAKPGLSRHASRSSGPTSLARFVVLAALLGCACQAVDGRPPAAPTRPAAPVATPREVERRPEIHHVDAGEGDDPAQDATAPPAGGRPAIQVSIGAQHACVLLAEGSVWCWSWSRGDAVTVGTPARPVAGLSDIVQISAGGGHTCALDAIGILRCWGANGAGQLGDGTKVSRTEPAEVAVLQGISSVAAGGQHTCAVTKAGRAYCWGGNGHAQLGAGTLRDSTRPHPVRGLEGVTKIFAGNGNSCALRSGGSVRCWGDNHYRQVGPCRRPHHRGTPVILEGASDIADVAVGEAHVCTLTTGGAMECRGRRAPVVDVGLVDQVVASRRGPGHCMRLRDGEVRCWGMAGSGCHVRNIGFGPGGFDCEPHGGQPPDDVFCLAPIAISLRAGVEQIAIGNDRACAVLQDGDVWCWSMHAPPMDRLESASQPPRAAKVVVE